jgi:hypothetical protein
VYCPPAPRPARGHAAVVEREHVPPPDGSSAERLAPSSQGAVQSRPRIVLPQLPPSFADGWKLSHGCVQRGRQLTLSPKHAYWYWVWDPLAAGWGRVPQSPGPGGPPQTTACRAPGTSSRHQVHPSGSELQSVSEWHTVLLHSQGFGVGAAGVSGGLCACCPGRRCGCSSC